MKESRFLVVEFPAPDLLLTGFTARHACTIDLMSEPAVELDGDQHHPSILLVKGLAPQELALLKAQIAKVYGVIRVIDDDAERRTWLARIAIPESKLGNPGARLLLNFQHRYGVPWTHLEAGVLHMRARIENPDDGDLLADQCRRFFREVGVDAQVDVQDISARDYGVWEDLVEHAIGIAG